jgi:hypothetical protein
MPRYYFHIHDGKFLPDVEGTELPDDGAAREAALVLSGDILREGGGASLWNGADWNLWVTQQPDHTAPKLFTLRFSAEAAA